MAQALSRRVTLSVNPLPSAAELRFPDRDVADTLDYPFDLTAWLADAGETIAPPVAVTSNPADLTLQAVIANGTAVVVRIGGGTLTNPITDYEIIVAVTLAGGETLTRSIWQRVTKLSMNASYTGTAVATVRGSTGVGITGITQPNGPATAVIALSDNTTQTVDLPAGVGIASITPLGVGYVIALTDGTSLTYNPPVGPAGPPGAVTAASALVLANGPIFKSGDPRLPKFSWLITSAAGPTGDIMLGWRPDQGLETRLSQNTMASIFAYQASLNLPVITSSVTVAGTQTRAGDPRLPKWRSYTSTAAGDIIDGVLVAGGLVTILAPATLAQIPTPTVTPTPSFTSVATPAAVYRAGDPRLPKYQSYVSSAARDILSGVLAVDGSQLLALSTPTIAALRTQLGGALGPFRQVTTQDVWLGNHFQPDTHGDDTANSGGTYASVWNFETAFDGVQLDFTYDANTACTVFPIVSVSTNFADPLNPAGGAWTPVTFASGGAALPLYKNPIPNAGPTSIVLNTTQVPTQEAHTWSDVIWMPSAARTDGGPGTILYTRTKAVGVPRPLFIRDNLLPSIMGGRAAGDYFAAGDYVTNPAGMPNNGPSGRMMPSAVRAVGRGVGLAIVISGASLISGLTTTNNCNNFAFQTQIALSTSANPITVWNNAVSGTNSTDYTQRLHNLLDVMQFPVVIITPWTRNDLNNMFNNAAVSQAAAYASWQRAMGLVERIRAYGGRPILLCPTPLGSMTTISEPWRLWAIARCYEALAAGIDIIDPNPLVADTSVYPARILPQYTSDNEHMTDAGHAVIVPLLTTILNRYRGLGA